jgi:hypothetical protein
VSLTSVMEKWGFAGDVATVVEVPNPTPRIFVSENERGLSEAKVCFS